MNDALNYAENHRESFLAELVSFLEIPSISTQPEHAGDVRAAANWLAEAMRQAGIDNVRIIDTERHPLVYGDWLGAGPDAPTLLVYGHYDVQPPDPLVLWQSPPFEPTVRGDHLYARGATDDKGQLFIHVKVAEAYLRATGRLPANLKYIFEGEEESGSENLSVFVREQGEALLKGDAALISDSHILGPDQPSLVYGLRGLLYCYLTVTGPEHDLHSGGYGGAINNPLNALGHLIAQLKDEEGNILIPGFYDDVRDLDEEERALLNRRAITEEMLLAETGAPAGWGEPSYTIAERIGARPTLDFHGIIGGYTGPGGKTVLPSSVEAKFSMRLVPDQDPERIAGLVRDYLATITPPSVKVQFEAAHYAKPAVVDYDIPAVQAAAAAYEEVFGRPPIFIRGGGTIPVVSDFQSYLGMESILMGFGLPDDRIHSPNERFYLPNFYRGIETVVRFLDLLAKWDGDERR